MSTRGVLTALLALVITAVTCVPGRASGQQAKHIPAPGGDVAIVSDADQTAYDSSHYAAIRRAGDCLYLSGLVVRRPEGSPNDVDAFKAQTRLVFQRLQQRLAAEGASFADVTMINSFHVWEGPDFAGAKADQFKAFREVKDEFMSAPYPAWTAVGTTGLLGEHGIVEVQMIAYAPTRKPAKSRK